MVQCSQLQGHLDKNEKQQTTKFHFFFFKETFLGFWIIIFITNYSAIFHYE